MNLTTLFPVGDGVFCDYNEGVMMLLKVNGANEEVENDLTLAGLILLKNIPTEGLVFVLNDEVIPAKSWNNQILKNNDVIELLNFVSGG